MTAIQRMLFYQEKTKRSFIGNRWAREDKGRLFEYQSGKVKMTKQTLWKETGKKEPRKEMQTETDIPTEAR